MLQSSSLPVMNASFAVLIALGGADRALRYELLQAGRVE